MPSHTAIGVVGEEEAKRLAAVSRLRNRLVHDYEDTSRSRILAEFGRAPELFTGYMTAVTRYISSDVEAAEPREE